MHLYILYIWHAPTKPAVHQAVLGHHVHGERHANGLGCTFALLGELSQMVFFRASQSDACAASAGMCLLTTCGSLEQARREGAVVTRQSCLMAFISLAAHIDLVFWLIWF